MVPKQKETIAPQNEDGFDYLKDAGEADFEDGECNLADNSMIIEDDDEGSDNVDDDSGDFEFTSAMALRKNLTSTFENLAGVPDSKSVITNSSVKAKIAQFEKEAGGKVRFTDDHASGKRQAPISRPPIAPSTHTAKGSKIETKPFSVCLPTYTPPCSDYITKR